MEPQMTHSHGHHYEQDPVHSGGHQHEEEGHEHHHTSVLKKVKAKAKKIKDTITKHGQGHDHHREDVPDDHDLDEDEDDDEDEEIVQDPKVHGAPMNESTAIRSDVADQGYSRGPNPEDLTARPVDPRAPTVKPESYVPGHHHSGTRQPGLSSGVIRSSDEVPQRPQNTPQYQATDFRQRKEADPAKTFVPGQEEYSVQPKVNLERPRGMEVDSAAPGVHRPSNYQTKIIDPTGKGDQEADVSGVLQALDETHISGKTKPKSGQVKQNPNADKEEILTSVPTGSHDQFAPELTPPRRVTVQETTDSTKHHQDQPRDITAPVDKMADQSSYTDKISSATPAVADKPISAKNVVASKLSYGGNPEEDKTGERLHQGQQEMQGEKHGSTYADKLSYATSAIAGKAASAKNAVASKLGYGEKGRDVAVGERNPQHQLHEGEEHKDQSSSYTDKISSATSAIVGKATSAKNVVASKLGYGEKDNTSETRETHLGERVENKPGLSTGDHGKKITSTVAEKLAPVYGTVAGAGSAMMSKIPGAKTGGGDGNEKQVRSSGVQEQDKGVTMKEYIAEKLRPGEEDKALSEAISDVLHKRKTEPERKLEPTGKVTESVEVRTTLGPTMSDEDSPKKGAGSSLTDNSAGNSVVDKIKGTVGSWFGKGEGPSVSPSTGTGSEETLKQGVTQGREGSKSLETED